MSALTDIGGSSSKYERSSTTAPQPQQQQQPFSKTMMIDFDFEPTSERPCVEHKFKEQERVLVGIKSSYNSDCKMVKSVKKRIYLMSFFPKR